MKALTLLFLGSALATALTACSPAVQALDAKEIEAKYGLTGAFADTITTPDGPLSGMLVPITLADGRPGHLFIPQRQANDLQSVYLRDENGLHPMQVSPDATRAQLQRAVSVVDAKPQLQPQRAKKRSWEKEVLIVGGSAGAGTAIGAIAGGKKGAGIGAAAGGVGGLIYDLATRDKK